MILVTVGTHTQNFTRLVKATDDLVGSGKIKDKVVIQTGYTDYKPKNCKWFAFKPLDEFEKLCKRSDIIISHGGVGSIMLPLLLGKSLIVMPRLKKFKEHTDDHQLQIVQELEKQKKIIAIYDVKNLILAIKKAKKFKPKRLQRENRISTIIENYLKKQEGEL